MGKSIIETVLKIRTAVIQVAWALWVTVPYSWKKFLKNSFLVRFEALYCIGHPELSSYLSFFVSLIDHILLQGIV